MAKITWTFKNEEGTNLNRYIATNISTGEKITFDLLRGGNISVVGTPLNAENLNALITSINACYDLITSSEKDTTYTLSKNGNAIRLTASNGKTNDVTLSKSDVGLGNVDNTSDKDKPISTATQNALNNKVPITRKINGYSLNADVTLNKSDVGLGNVDNTSDKDKPISTATQQALDLKANKSETYTKEETNSLIDEVVSGGADLTNYYTKTETDARIAEKLDEKQTTEVNCSHEVEITGFGEEDCNLVIDDQDVVITKIQGQTRRKSLNLLNIADVSETTTNGITYSVKNGVITLNGTATSYVGIRLGLLTMLNNGNYAISWFNEKSAVITCQLRNKNNDNIISTTLNAENKTGTFTNDVVAMTINIPSGTTLNNFKYKPMLVSGTTAPTTYEPYDNRLVNSKCDFVSTGRNLFNKDTITKGVALSNTGGTHNNASYFTSDYIYLIPNTYIVMNFGNGWYNLYDNQKNYVNQATTTTFTITQPMYIRFSAELVYIDRFMLNYGNTALPYEPYVEDTMQCGIELGAYDYHDNINHITHRQTSEIITLNGSENWVIRANSNSEGLKVFGIAVEKDAFYSWDKVIGVSNNDNYSVRTLDFSWLRKNVIGILDKSLCIASDTITTVDDFKSWLQANPITLVYKLATETTEENILPSGYKVWYKGMQVQKTNTIPYIVTKQYAISLASQVLNNVSIDRSQQKQIDDLKEKQSNLLNEIDDVRILPQQSDTSRTLISITADNISDYFNANFNEEENLELTPIRPNEEVTLYMDKDVADIYQPRKIILYISGFNKNSYDVNFGVVPFYCNISIDNNIPINLGTNIDSYNLFYKHPYISYTTGDYMYIRCVGRVCYISNQDEL